MDGWEENRSLRDARNRFPPATDRLLDSGKCYTIFSAPNYCDSMGNKGAFMTIYGGRLAPPQFT